MHKYLENANRSYNSIPKELQIHPYTISCVIQCFSLKLVRKPVNGFNINPGLSLREHAKGYRFSQSFVGKFRNKY